MRRGRNRLFFSRLFLRQKGELAEFAVEALQPHKNSYILKLKGIDSLLEANSWSGADVFALEDEFRPLAEDSYYEFQLLGCTVLTRAGERVGVVRELLEIPENTVLVVAEGRKEIYIPFSRKICVSIDIEKREIRIEPPDGLLELNEI